MSSFYLATLHLRECVWNNMKNKILTDVNFLHMIIKTFFKTVVFKCERDRVKNKSARAKNEYFNV